MEAGRAQSLQLKIAFSPTKWKLRFHDPQSSLAFLHRCSAGHGPKCLAFGRALRGLTSSVGTGGGTRTRTGIAPQRILSPLRLPFRHTGVRP